MPPLQRRAGCPQGIPPRGGLCTAAVPGLTVPRSPPSEEDIVIEEFARHKLKGEKDDEEREEADKEES